MTTDDALLQVLDPLEIALDDCRTTTAPELCDLLTECAPATTWCDRIRECIDDVYDDAQTALIAEELALTLVALERLVAFRFRAALDAQAVLSMRWDLPTEQTADPFGLIVALRGLAHVQLITPLAHPEHRRAIVSCAARHDQNELCRLLQGIEAVDPIRPGSASQEATQVAALVG
jgi:hypothetical protein